jgi:4-amino-4-deoxy-L-arabinose transferase-like glycosyltransferase
VHTPEERRVETTARPSQTRPPQSALHDTPFLVGLAIVTGAGLAIRLTNVLVWRRHYRPGGDAFYYYLQGIQISHGQWFNEPLTLQFLHQARPSADHPPLYSLFLGASFRIAGTSVTTARVASCLLGAATVALITLVGWVIAGRGAALVAGGLAAVYPALWINDGMVMSESIAAVTVALFLLACYRFWRNPSLAASMLIGVAGALVALSRAELLLLLPLVAVPLVIGAGLGRRRAVVVGGTAFLVAGLVLAPWVGFNLARFERPEFVSTGLGGAVDSGSCDPVTSGPLIGYWQACFSPAARYADESVADAAYRNAATNYWRHHLGRLPATVAARVGRLWDVYRPNQDVALAAKIENRGHWASRAAQIGLYLLLPLAVVGLVAMRRRNVPIWPLLSTAVVVTLTAAAFWGGPRFRVPADVAIVVAAGVGVDFLRELVSRRERRAPA